ncbi:hypothetical protein [Vibrio alginolyticus]
MRSKLFNTEESLKLAILVICGVSISQLSSELGCTRNTISTTTKSHRKRLRELGYA